MKETLLISSRSCPPIRFLFALFFLGTVVFAPCALAEDDFSTEQLLSELAPLKDSLPDAAPAELLVLLEEALTAYAALENYESVFYKTERSGEGMGEREEIFLKFEKPFKIFMGWENTHKKGLQVFYERGEHDGKLVIHKPGLLFGLMPVIYLDQNSPWVREGSASYNIEDAGIGTFLLDFTNAVIRAVQEKKLEVAYGETIEVTFADTAKDEDYFAYRIVVDFDAETHLPVLMELYDWEDALIGTYEYTALQLNVEAHEEFKKHIHGQLYKVYSGQTDKPPAEKKERKKFSLTANKTVS